MDQVKIGRFIAELRKSNALTQEALGEELGVTNKTISRWETGVYMPDIEMLKLLSDRFSVSINELLSGEVLSDTDFRKAADENLVAVSKTSVFSMKEKSDFWKQKWLREHIALVLLCIAFCIGLFVFAWLKHIVLLVGLTPILCLIVYASLRNKMMIYIENQLYGQYK